MLSITQSAQINAWMAQYNYRPCAGLLCLWYEELYRYAEYPAKAKKDVANTLGAVTIRVIIPLYIALPVETAKY